MMDDYGDDDDDDDDDDHDDDHDDDNIHRYKWMTLPTILTTSR